MKFKIIKSSCLAIGALIAFCLLLGTLGYAVLPHRPRITAIAVRTPPLPTRVYNLAIEKNENYFVSSSNIFVHNCSMKYLGSGSWGDVFEYPGGKVVAKFLRPDRLQGWGDPERLFQGQVVVARRLEEALPGIAPKVYGEVVIAHPVTGVPSKALLLEKLSGKTLSAKYGGGDFPSLPESVRAQAHNIVRKLTESGRIIHEPDIIGGNFIVSDTGVVRVLDIGLHSTRVDPWVPYSLRTYGYQHWLGFTPKSQGGYLRTR